MKHQASTTSTRSFGKAVQDDLRGPGRELRNEIPEVYVGFSALHAAALAAGALDAKTKELIALAIATSKGCDGCIAAHARAVAKLGASVAEVGEAVGVAILMSGGPGTTHGAKAFGAFREFRDAELARSQELLAELELQPA